jgi:hypothetical protein
MLISFLPCCHRREMYGSRFDEKPFVLQTASQEQVIENREEVYRG